MKSIAEIRRADEKELLALAKQRIGKFSILKRIYDNGFLFDLVQHKNDCDNRLLLRLVIDEPTAIKFFKEIEENLELFQNEENIQKLKTKLRQWETIPFESTIVELEFAADYKRRGYQIEIEPELPNNQKGDFCASKDSMKIYFEVKTIYTASSIKDHAILYELEDSYSGMGLPFVIGIDLENNFKRNQTVEVSKHIQRKLREIQTTHISLPFSFVYPENSKSIVTVNVSSRLPDGEKGYVSGSEFGGGIKGEWSDLRSKISSGISQLHPNHPGVMVIKPNGLETARDDIENALFGDPRVNLFGKPKSFRGGDRIFAKNKNKRLSAVIYYQNAKKFIYHNPYSEIKLSPEIFKGKNVIQFIPIHQDDGSIYYKELRMST